MADPQDNSPAPPAGFTLVDPSTLPGPPAGFTEIDPTKLNLPAPPPGFTETDPSTLSSGTLTTEQHHDLASQLEDQGFLDSAVQAFVGPFKFAYGFLHGDVAKHNQQVAALMNDPNTPLEVKRTTARDELLSNIPFASTVYKLWKGNIGGAAGDVTGMAGLGVAGKLGSTLMESDIGKSAPEVGMVRAQNPPKTDVSYTADIRPAMEDIKQYGNAGGHIATNEQLVDASQRGMDQFMNELDGWKARVRPYGAFIDSTALADATKRAIPPDMWRENPQQAQALVDQIDRAYRGKKLTVDEAFDLLSTKNNQLAGFNSKSPAAQQAAITAGTPQGVLEAQVNALRDTVYNALDPQNAGAGPREIQQRYGRMKDVRDYARLQTTNAATKGKAMTTLGAVAKSSAGALDVLNPLHGNIEESVGRVVTPWRGSVDPLIDKSFRAIGPARPIPRPAQPSIWPAGPTAPNNSVRASLGRGQFNVGVRTPGMAPDIEMPDTSGGGAQPLAPHQRTQTMRPALPEGRFPFTQGTAVPDIAGEIQSGFRRVLAHERLPMGQQPSVGGPHITGERYPTGIKGGEPPAGYTPVDIEMEGQPSAKAIPAKRVVIKDPETGEEKVYYTSQPHKKGGVVVEPPPRYPEVDRLMHGAFDRQRILDSLKK